MVRRQFSTTALLLASVSIACVVPTRGSYQLVTFDSSPSGARVTLEPGGLAATAPVEISLDRRLDYEATFTLAGFQPAVVPLSRVDTFELVEGVGPGAAVAIGVYRRSGAFYEFTPNPVIATLRAPEPSDVPGLGRPLSVVFVNTTDPAFFNGRTGRVSIRLGEADIGTLLMGGRRRVSIQPGNYRLYLEHRDLWLFADEYDLELDTSVAEIHVFNGILSTRYELKLR